MVLNENFPKPNLTPTITFTKTQTKTAKQLILLSIYIIQCKNTAKQLTFETLSKPNTERNQTNKQKIANHYYEMKRSKMKKGKRKSISVSGS